MVNIWQENYRTNQNYWMVNTEEGFGFDAACQMDEKVAWSYIGVMLLAHLYELPLGH
jgi:hypothetical protein